jgi:HlyD family secretion protein
MSQGMKKALIFVGILLSLACLMGLSRIGRHASSSVQTEAVARRIIRSSVLASGKITFEEKASLTSQVIGIVKSVNVAEGQAVKKDDLVMQLDASLYAAQSSQAQAAVQVQVANLENAKLTYARNQRQYERNKAIYDRQLVSQVDSAVASLAQARASAAAADQTLKWTRIYSPIDGVVTSIDLKEGETAIPGVSGIPGSVLMTIANPGSIYSEVNIDEADIGNVRIGDHANVIAVAYPDTPLRGVIVSIATTAKVAQGRQGLSFVVKIRLPDLQGLKLRDGMSCRAEVFTRDHDNVLAVPIGAVTVQEDRKANTSKQIVFVAKDGIAHRKVIKTGISDDDYQEVTDGLDQGDQLIVGPAQIMQSLHDGDPVSATVKSL